MPINTYMFDTYMFGPGHGLRESGHSNRLISIGLLYFGPHREQNFPALGSSGWSWHVGNVTVLFPPKLHMHFSWQTASISWCGAQSDISNGS